MKKSFLVFFILLIAVTTSKVFSQGTTTTASKNSSVITTAVPFLLLAPDSRAGGMGESGGGLADNSSAIFWNPAGIAFLTGSEVGFTHSNWLPQFNLDMFYDYATYRQYIESLGGSITASVTFMNFGEFIQTGSDSPEQIGTFRSFDGALTLGYATKLSDDWGLGFNFRVIHSRLAPKGTEQEQGSGTATSVSFDVATMWRPSHLEIPFLGDVGNKFSMGLNLSNLGPKIYYIDKAQADPIPTDLRLGMAFRILEDDVNSLTCTVDFTKLMVEAVKDSTTQQAEFYKAIFTSWTDRPFSEELRSINTSVGLEYWYGGISQDFKFALRAGFFYEDPDYGNRKFATFGAGIRYDTYGFDFSYITTDIFKGGENHPLSQTLRFSLSIGWGGSPQKTAGLPHGI
jgi:hypothetical protein